LLTFPQTTYALSVTYPFSLGLVKISILFFYLRLFVDASFRFACYIMGVIMACITLGCSLSQALACRPISLGWSLKIHGGHCTNEAAIQYSATALNLVTDIAILLMPMKYLLRQYPSTVFRVGCGLIVPSRNDDPKQ
jgi:hypothetical protein